MEKKILLAIDDSENARRAVEFVAIFFAPDSKITLFNVIPDTATLCAMNSPELAPYFISQRSSFCLLEEKKRKLVNEALQKAKRILLDAKFEENNITISNKTLGQIILANCSNFIIKNIKISKMDQAILLGHSTNNIITNNT
ncbi:MAG: universal stress protein, partial [Gammaproteobacteria bacterium]|nr:universal stress protein [Gammaproteobacteria bacterium]